MKFIPTIFSLFIFYSCNTNNKPHSISKGEIITVTLPQSSKIIEPIYKDLINIKDVAIEPGLYIYVKDKQKLFVFDWSGKFQFQIDLTNYFEWESCIISDYTWDSELIYISCREKNELLIFNKYTGKFITAKDVPFDIIYFVLVNDQFFCYQHPNPFVNTDLNYELIVIDKNIEIIEKYFPFELSESNLFEAILGPKNLSTHAGLVSFTRFMSDSVYYINNKTEMKVKRLGFPGLNNFTLSENITDPVIFEEESYIFPLSFTFNTHYESTLFLKGENPYWAIRKLKSENWKIIESWKYNNDALPPFTKIVDNYLLIFVTDEGAIAYNKQHEVELGSLKKLIDYESNLVLFIVDMADIQF